MYDNNGFSINIKPKSSQDLVSTAWRTYFLNIYGIFLYPTILFTFIQLSIYLFDNDGYYEPAIIRFLTYYIENPPIFVPIVILGTIIVGWLMTSFLYNKLNKETLTHRELFTSIKLSFTRILLLWVSFIVQIIVFIIIDVIMFMVFSLAFTGLGTLLDSLRIFRPSELIGIPMIIFFFTLFLIMWFIISYQLFFLLLQIAISNIEKIGIKESFLFAFYITSSTPTLTRKFVISLFFLQNLLIFNTYIYLVIIVSIIITTVFNYNSEDTFAFNFMDILSFWLSNILFWPFIFSGVVVFYYNYKVNTQGIDLKLALEDKHVVEKDK